MASAWQEAAFQQAQLGLDLGLKPHTYPWWVFLAVPGLLGLLFLVLVVRAAAPRRSTKEEEEKGPAPPVQPVSAVQPVKSPKAEDPKKKAKKKLPEKAKPNGRPVELVQEAITTVKRDSVKQQTEAEKKNDKNKKNKKRLRSDSKPTQSTANTEKKDAEEGNWETKISNREKRQQRKRDKGTDSDLSEVAASFISETFTSLSAPPAGVRKTKGSSEVSAVNGSTWNEKPAKLITPQLVEEKWVPAAPSGKKKAEPCTWNPETGDANGKDWSVPWSERAIFPGLAPWSAVDGRVNKVDPRPPSFSTIGLNHAIPAVLNDPGTRPIVSDSQWDVAPTESCVDDEWGGLNGLSSSDPSSDWNAPAEVWGNYDEEEPGTVQPEEPEQEAAMVSDNEKEEAANQNSSSGKTKKKKKKKKKQGEESGSPGQDGDGVDGEVVIVKEIAPAAPAQAAKSAPIAAGKANEPKKPSEQKTTNEQKKQNEPKKAGDVKKTSAQKTEQKKSEQKSSESKKASEQKTSEPKKANEPKKSNEHKKTSDQKKSADVKKSEEESRSVTVLVESPVLNTLTEKSSSKVQQPQEKNASVNKQNIVPPPLQGKSIIYKRSHVICNVLQTPTNTVCKLTAV
uniref:Metadherin n=1 Tax=Leptobrachium leishanense TaxID=445787 RepID=A0A8C5PFM6_9ANUR